MSRLRDSVAALSPAHRRWVRFLHSLPLDVDELPAPVAPPGPDDFIICGCPRTGTTLVTGALFQPPRVVTVMEPWDGMRLAPQPLFESLRTEIDTTGRLGRGRLDLDALRERGAAEWRTEDGQDHAVAVQPGWKLGVKWPGYWRYLDRLPTTRFIVCLRDPVEVITSLSRVTGPGRHGLERDTKFDRALNRTLRAATSDPELRRIALFDHVHEQLLPHLERDNVCVVRYERWFDDAPALLDELSAFLDADVRHPGMRVALRSAPHDDGPIRRVVQEHCRTAAALGYRV